MYEPPTIVDSEQSLQPHWLFKELIHIMYFLKRYRVFGFKGKDPIKMPKFMRKPIELNALVFCIILLRYTQGNACIS